MLEGYYHLLAMIAAIGDLQVFEVQTKSTTVGLPAAAPECAALSD